MLTSTRVCVASLLLSLTACAGTSATKPPTLDLGTPAPQVSAMVGAADATRESEAYGEALLIYQQILIADGKNTAALYGIAECLFALGSPKDARPLFEGLTQNPDYRNVALQGKGLAELALGQRDAAEPDLRMAVEADPTLWRSWNALGEIADFRHQPDTALTAYARALDLKPGSPAIINNIGYSMLLARKPEPAVEEFKKALALDPGSATILNNLRLAIAASGNYAEAVKAATRNDAPIVFNNVGFVAMERGDYSIAQSYLARAMEGSPSYDSIAAKNLDQLKARQGIAQ
jgi:Flp pilus assembly protein TadD